MNQEAYQKIYQSNVIKSIFSKSDNSAEMRPLYYDFDLSSLLELKVVTCSLCSNCYVTSVDIYHRRTLESRDKPMSTYLLSCLNVCCCRCCFKLSYIIWALRHQFYVASVMTRGGHVTLTLMSSQSIISTFDVSSTELSTSTLIIVINATFQIPYIHRQCLVPPYTVHSNNCET